MLPCLGASVFHETIVLYLVLRKFLAMRPIHWTPSRAIAEDGSMVARRRARPSLDAKHPCVSLEAPGARFELHPPTPFELDLGEGDYRMLIPFGSAAIDVALGDAAPRRLRARLGNLALAEPGERFTARYVEPLEFLLITLGPERARGAAEAAAGSRWRSGSLLQWHDPAVTALGAEMRRALLAEGSQAMGPYLGALGDALFTRAVIGLSSESAKAPGSALAPSKLARVLRHIEANLGQAISSRELAEIAGVSPSHFARAFAKETGDPPHRFVIKRRVCRAREMLASGKGSIADIAARAGFASQAHLTTAFLREVGTTPGRYRAALARGEESEQAG